MAMATKPLGMGRKLGAAPVISLLDVTSSLARTGCPDLISTRAKYWVFPDRSAVAEKWEGGASAEVIFTTFSESWPIAARAGMSDAATTTETSPVLPTIGGPTPAR